MTCSLYYALVVCALVWSNPSRATPLDDYVNKPDPTYEWRDLGKAQRMDGYTVYYINMTSQTWLTHDIVSCSVWWHIMAISVPDHLSNTNTAFMYITGGSNHDSIPDVTETDVLMSASLAFSTGTITATLFQIPNQPCLFSEDVLKKQRSEDAIIAFTWYHFLNHPDQPEYLLRLPMTKAAVRAMDTITAFVKQKNSSVDISKFIIAGASKRGWTTWTTGVVSKRVIAMIPIVEDALNLKKNLHHMYRAYGGWTFAFEDYMALNVTANLDDPNMQKMADIIDPYVYRDRMADIPKLVIDAGGDEFFLPDDNHYFWDDIPGEKYLRMVPNAEHSLANAVITLLLGIRSFLLSVTMDVPMPKMTWKLENNAGGGSITFMSDIQPIQVRVFHATTLSTVRRDFRLLTGPDPHHPTVQPVLWFGEKLSPQPDGSYVANMSVPDAGWRAFFIEAFFAGPQDSVLEYTTQVNIVPDKFPFPDCYGESCRGKLV